MFNYTNSQDQNLFAKFVQEQIQQYGQQIQYWVVTFNANKDKLYAEDTQPHITAKYDMTGYFQPITELFNFNSKFGGFFSPDVIEMYLSQLDFKEILADYDAIPKEGDYVYINFLDRVFQVTSVITDSTIFLQKKFSYKLVLNSANAIGATTTLPGTDSLAISGWGEEEADLDDNATITEEAGGIVVDKTNDTDPFGEWQ